MELRLLQRWGSGHTEPVHHHLRSLPDSLGEGREGELELGDVFDAHPRRHAGRDDLDHLGGVLAEDVGADDRRRAVSTISLQNPFGWPSATGRRRSS